MLNTKSWNFLLYFHLWVWLFFRIHSIERISLGQKAQDMHAQLQETLKEMLESRVEELRIQHEKNFTQQMDSMTNMHKEQMNFMNK